MHRVDGADFAAGNLFREGNPALGLLATQLTADIMNAFQQEIATVIENEGIALVKADNTQLKTAIEKTVVRLSGQRARQYFFAQI